MWLARNLVWKTGSVALETMSKVFYLYLSLPLGSTKPSMTVVSILTYFQYRNNRTPRCAVGGRHTLRRLVCFGVVPWLPHCRQLDIRCGTDRYVTGAAAE